MMKQENSAIESKKAAQNKRAEQREAKVTAGLQEFSVWLRDLVRSGLVTAKAQPYSYWDTAAARLVDAQASGVARMVREMASISNSGNGWQDRLLSKLGQVYLLLEGFKRLEVLPKDVQADIRTQIGWTQSQEELSTHIGVRDRWLILGTRVVSSDKLLTQRTWLWGKETKSSAVIINYAYGNQPLDNSLVPGTTIDADLVFFDSAYPLRAIVKTLYDKQTALNTIPTYSNINEMLQTYALAIARNPWLEEFPLALKTMTVVHYNGCWYVQDAEGKQLPLLAKSQRTWQLLAVSGGYAVDLFGEWDGEYLCPLSALLQGSLVSF